RAKGERLPDGRTGLLGGAVVHAADPEPRGADEVVLEVVDEDALPGTDPQALAGDPVDLAGGLADADPPGDDRDVEELVEGDLRAAVPPEGGGAAGAG